MTTRSSARHRKATRPLTPISHIAPATRRGLVVAASSGLALTMIASGANAASSTEVAASAGSLQQTAGLGALTADAREAVTVNDAIVIGDVVAPDTYSHLTLPTNASCYISSVYPPYT